MTNAVIYARFSSHKQEDGFSIQGQLDACRAFADKNGWPVVGTYIDEAISGTIDQRDGFQEMIHASKLKKFDVVLVWKYNRFSRDRYDSVVYKKKLEKNDVRVVSITEPVGFGDESSALLEAIYEGMAQDESRRIGRDAMRGMIQGAKAGFWQNGEAPIGYRVLKVPYQGALKSKLELDPDHAPTVRRIFDLYLSRNHGFKSISNILNNEGRRTVKGNPTSANFVKNILANETYTGSLVFNREERRGYPIVRVPDAHPAIITFEEFDEAQNILKPRKINRSRPTEYLLSGLIKCKCGHSYSGRTATSRTGQKHRYYECSQKVKRGRAICDSAAIRADAFDERVIDVVRTRIVNEDTITEVTTDLVNLVRKTAEGKSTELKSVVKEIARLQKKYDRLINFITENDSVRHEDIAPAISDTRGKIVELESRQEVLKANIVDVKSLIRDDHKVVETYASLVHQLLSGLSLFNSASLKKFIQRIEVNGDVCDLYWNFPEQSAQFARGEEWLPVLSLMRTKLYRLTFTISRVVA